MFFVCFLLSLKKIVKDYLTTFPVVCLIISSISIPFLILVCVPFVYNLCIPSLKYSFPCVHFNLCRPSIYFENRFACVPFGKYNVSLTTKCKSKQILLQVSPKTYFLARSLITQRFFVLTLYCEHKLFFSLFADIS